MSWKGRTSGKELCLNRRETGMVWEQAAAEYLERQGYRIVEKNFYSRYGEIDLIAEDGETLVFVEVKYRSGTKIQSPEEAVDRKKQKKICRTADYYRLVHRIPEDHPCRFDVAAWTPEGVCLYRNAFPYCGV